MEGQILNYVVHFQIGGYTTPFAVLGSALFLAAVMTTFVLPVHEINDEISHNNGGKFQFFIFYLSSGEGSARCSF